MNAKVLYQKNSHGQSSQPKLDKLRKATDRLIYKCESMFPFTLFTDSVLIDLNKVDIVYRNFFFSESVFTLMFEDVRTVKVSNGPIFATMRFEVTGYEQNPAPVSFLPKSEAGVARQIILGLTVAKREGINLEELENKMIRKKAAEIGATHNN